MEQWDLKPARDLGKSLDERNRDLARESGLLFTATHLAWWAYVRFYLACWHRLRVEGREKIPRELPFVLVANHSSHLDAMVLASPLPMRLRDRIFPIAAGDVFFETPLVSAFAASMINALPMWRRKAGRHALDQLRERLVSEPCAYILFPEGARSRTGDMLPFKHGLGMLVAGTSVPVVPCHLTGCFESLPAGRKLARPRKIRMRVGEPLRFAEVANDREGWQRIASDVEAGIRALIPPGARTEGGTP